MGLLSSKRKTYVSSYATGMYEKLPDTVKTSIAESIVYNTPAGMTVADNLINGVNKSLRQGMRYAKTKYTNGVPRGTAGYYGVNKDLARTHLSAKEGAPVEILDIYNDWESELITVLKHLAKTHGYDGRDILQSPTGVVKAKLDEISTRNKTDFIPVIINELIDEFTFTTQEGDSVIKSTATVIYKNSEILEEENVAYFTGMEDTTPEFFKKDNNIPGDDWEYNWGRMYYDFELKYGFKSRAKINASFEVIQNIEKEISTVNELGETVISHEYEFKSTLVDRLHEPEVTLIDEVTDDVFFRLDSKNELILFYKVDGSDYIKHFYYEEGDSPANLIGAFTQSLTGAFYPVINLRDDNKDPTREAVRHTEIYKTTKKLCKRMGLDYQQLVDAINDSPDVKELDFAHLVIGIPLTTETQQGLDYLYRFFKDIMETAHFNKANYEAYMDMIIAKSEALSEGSTGGAYIPSYASGFTYNYLEVRDKQYHVRIGYSYILENVVQGSIGKVGHFTKEVLAPTDGKRVHMFGNSFFIADPTDPVGESKLILRKQINENEYLELTVAGLSHTNYAYRHKHMVVTTLSDLTDEDRKGNFIIPLHEGIAKKVSPIKRDKLYYEAHQIVINTYVIVKIKWYQQGWFKALTLIATVYFGGPMLAANFAGVATAMQFVIALGTLAFYSLLLNLAFRLVVRLIGEDAALFIAIAIAIYTAGRSLQKGGLNAVPNADVLLTSVNGLVSAVKNSIAAELKKLTNESNAFITEMKDKFDELKKINDDLDFQKFIDPLWFINYQPLYIPGETPADYYQRSINTNPGVEGYEMLEKYVDIMLTLPERVDSDTDLIEEQYYESYRSMA